MLQLLTNIAAADKFFVGASILFVSILKHLLILFESEESQGNTGKHKTQVMLFWFILPWTKQQGQFFIFTNTQTIEIAVLVVF